MQIRSLMLLTLMLAAPVDAGLGIGASFTAGHSFMAGGRVRFIAENEWIPLPTLGVFMTPIPEKRFFRTAGNSYMQLREGTVLIDIAITEQFRFSDRYGAEASLSLGVFEGWYRGSARDYPITLAPMLAAGPRMNLSDVFALVPRVQWYYLDSVSRWLATFMIEVVIR